MDQASSHPSRASVDGLQAVVDKIRIQHRLLESQLASAVRAVASDDASDAISRVERLARSLDLHLTLEEDHYFPRQRDGHPALAGKLDELLVDHDSLRSVLEAVRGDLLSGQLASARAALASYADAFHAHEKREFELFAA